MRKSSAFAVQFAGLPNGVGDQQADEKTSLEASCLKVIAAEL